MSDFDADSARRSPPFVAEPGLSLRINCAKAADKFGDALAQHTESLKSTNSASFVIDAEGIILSRKVPMMEMPTNRSGPGTDSGEKCPNPPTVGALVTTTLSPKSESPKRVAVPTLGAPVAAPPAPAVAVAARGHGSSLQNGLPAHNGDGGSSLTPTSGPREFLQVASKPPGTEMPALDASTSGLIHKPASSDAATALSQHHDALIQRELNAIIGQKREHRDRSEESTVLLPSISPISVPVPRHQASARPGPGPASHALPASPPAQAGSNARGSGQTVSNRSPPSANAQALMPPTRHSTRGATAAAAAGISKSIEEACHAAALEDGVLSSKGGGALNAGYGNAKQGSVVSPGETSALTSANKAGKVKNGLRRGKWTPEEEAYANRLIVEFKSGLLPLTDGTTLRTFLSKLLNCDPMRISKKFVGQNCIGKQVFRRRQQADLDRLSTDEIERSRQELAELERRFLERVAQTNRCKNSVAGAKHGKDSAAGQVAPEVPRRQQEYLGPDGRIVGNPVLPPWMLPPAAQAANEGEPASASTTPRSNCSSGINSGFRGAAGPNSTKGTSRHHQNIAPEHTGATLHHISHLHQPSGLRRGPGGSDTGILSVTAATNMPRTDSQDSLSVLGRTISADALGHLTDFPHTTSLGDLAGLNMFTSSPFPSTDNLLSLHQHQHQQTVAAAPRGHTTLSAHNATSVAAAAAAAAVAPSSTSISRNTGDSAPRGPNVSGHGSQLPMSTTRGTVATVTQNPVITATARNGGGANTAGSVSSTTTTQKRIPRVDSATGLSSLRVMSGLPRNTSVEDFLSLVDYGDIPAPDKDLLSKCVFPQNSAARAAQTAASQQAAVAFTGIGKPSVILAGGVKVEGGAPTGPIPGGSHDVAGGKRDRGDTLPTISTGSSAMGARLKQPKIER